MLVSSVSELGMEPTRLLNARSKSVSFLSRDSESGISPIKLHAVSHKISRFVKLPNSGGIRPGVNGLYDKLSTLRVLMLPKKGGIIPSKRL